MKVISIKKAIIALALTLAAVIFAVTGGYLFARAERTNITVDKDHVFTGTSGALGSDVIVSDPIGEGDAAKQYTEFTIAYAEGPVSYRKNLAYRWIEAVEVEEGEEEGAEGEETEGETVELLSEEHAEKMFDMRIGFEKGKNGQLNFQKFTIRFQSQQYSMTEDGVTDNFIIFYPADGEGEEGKLYAVISDDEDAKPEADKTYAALDPIDIDISFTDYSSGDYTVLVSDGTVSESGTFTNIGGTYAKYVSASRNNSATPLTFSAEFEDEDADDREAAQMIMYSLNGQSFEVKDATYNETGEYYFGGTVTDDRPPVLCLDEKLTHFELSQQLNLDYAVIDVIASSPTATLNYYILGTDMIGGEKALTDKSLFTEASTDLSKRESLETDIGNYLPTTELEGTVFTDSYSAKSADKNDVTKKYTCDSLVKVYMTLRDTTGNGGETTDIVLDWYLTEEFAVKVGGVNFIAVGNDTLGACYSEQALSVDGDVHKAYQQAVTEAAEGISAGSDSRVYLPSAEDLFADNSTPYEDLKVNIYYRHSSTQSSTGLATENLSINVTQSGTYKFTLYASDAQNNSMYFYDADKGEITELSTADVWDEDMADKFPWFEFSVMYTGVTIEEPGAQSTAYVGTSYSPGSFTIKGIANSYSTSYSLYKFDRGAYFNGTGNTLTYEEFISEMKDLYEDSATRVYFEEIKPLGELDENTEDYDKFSPYAFNRSGTSFTPQDANAFYLVKAEVTDNRYGQNTTGYMGVSASVRAGAIRGESRWIKENMASVILLSVAGAAFIAIVLLLVIRPRKPEDADVEYKKVLDKKSKKG